MEPSHPGAADPCSPISYPVTFRRFYTGIYKWSSDLCVIFYASGRWRIALMVRVCGIFLSWDDFRVCNQLIPNSCSVITLCNQFVWKIDGLSIFSVNNNSIENKRIISHDIWVWTFHCQKSYTKTPFVFQRATFERVARILFSNFTSCYFEYPPYLKVRCEIQCAIS